MAKRYSQWMRSRVDALVLSGATLEFNMSGVDFVPSTGLESLRGYTMVRMIGELAIRPTVPLATGVGQFAAAVMLQGGRTSPNVNPNNENADYLWWYGGAVGYEGAETSAGFFGGITRYIRIDNRAMRRVAQ